MLDRIGHTPIVRLTSIDAGRCELYLKLESENPTGSIKDRIGLAMIEAAEREGKIAPGATLVEASAGNTGVSLAWVASLKGYAMIVVVSDKASQEKRKHLRELGAEVVVTRSDVHRGHSEYYQDVAARLAQERGAFFVDQFNNPANPLAHASGTAPELWQQMDEHLDAVVVGAGTGGALTGLARFFKDKGVEMILADPIGSVFAPFVQTGELVEATPWLIEGVGKVHSAKLRFVSGEKSLRHFRSRQRAHGEGPASAGGHFGGCVERYVALCGAALLSRANPK